jgi:DNA-binding NarL/FixJ family response regulator
MAHTGANFVLLADRHHGLTEGVRGLLETRFGAVLMVADEASLLEGAERIRPDLVIADLALARTGHLGWIRELRRRWPQVKLIVLSVYDEESVQRAAREAGADAFVVKRAIATDLLAAVERVCGGQSQDLGGLERASPSGPEAT